MNPKLAVFCETAHPGISMKGRVTKVLLVFFLTVYLWGKRKKRKSREMKGDKLNHLQAAKSVTASTDILHQCCRFDFHLSSSSFLAHLQGSFFH